NQRLRPCSEMRVGNSCVSVTRPAPSVTRRSRPGGVPKTPSPASGNLPTGTRSSHRPYSTTHSSTAPMADTDLLAEAVQRLAQAVTRLFGPALTEHGPTTSLWGQLVESIGHKPSQGMNGVFQPGAPAWIDAVDLVHTIETTVRGWAGIRDDPQTILDGWCTTSAWRPQDADVCAGYAETIHRWCRKAERMLTGGSVME